MATEELNVTVGMNANEFKTEMKDVNAELRNAEANFATASKTAGLLEDSAEGIQKQISALNNVMDAQKSKIETITTRMSTLDKEQMYDAALGCLDPN